MTVSVAPAPRRQLPADRQPRPRPAQRPHPPEAAARADRRLDPRVRLRQPDPDRCRGQDHRRPRPAAGGEVDRPDRGADDRAAAPLGGAAAGAADRRQQDRARRRLGPRPPEARARRAGGARRRPRPGADRLLLRRDRRDPQGTGRSRGRGDPGGAGGSPHPARRHLDPRRAPGRLRRRPRPGLPAGGGRCRCQDRRRLPRSALQRPDQRPRQRQGPAPRVRHGLGRDERGGVPELPRPRPSAPAPGCRATAPCTSSAWTGGTSRT